MGIRETINRHSAVSTTVMICAVVVGVVTIALELRGDSRKPPAESFYTTDDGKTWFVDSSSKLAPFDHDGVPAVHCYVFKGKDGKFVALLEKFSDDVRADLERRAQPGAVPNYSVVSVLVKKPGEKDWKSVGGAEESSILMKIATSDGSDIERVMP